jgi:flagellar biosynthesis protein FlhG
MQNSHLDALRGRATRPVIWAVASGKGGVGKSVVSASLAIGLSQTGPRAVAVDLDLGGANLHTLLGCERARYTLSDFARGRVGRIEEALTATTVPGVRLLSGARAELDVANASRALTQKILRSLAQLDAGHAVLDLGAGTSFHTLDAFLAADRRILVVTPEPTAIDNVHHFLKAAFFRALRDIAGQPDVRAALVSVLDEARRGGATPRELLEAASRADARAGAKLRACMREFEVDLVVNHADSTQSSARCAKLADAGSAIAAAARLQLGVTVRLAGSLAHDEAVFAAVERGVPVMQLFPAARFCTDVQAVIATLFEHEPASATRAFALTVAAPDRSDAALEAAAGEPAPHPSGPPGRALRARREQLGLDLRALHERTRIRYHYLEAIEAERFEALPPDVFLREYVRQIAAALAIADPHAYARHFVAVVHARRCGATGAIPVTARAPEPAPRASAPTPALPVPSAEELFAACDDEPELEELEVAKAEIAEPEPVAAPAEPAAELPLRLRGRASVAEIQAFLVPSATRALRRARRREARR